MANSKMSLDNNNNTDSTPFADCFIKAKYGLDLNALQKCFKQFMEDQTACYSCWKDFRQFTDKLNQDQKHKIRMSLFLDHRTLQAQMEKALAMKIVIVGRSGSAKSTLINILLMCLLLPADINPTTVRVTILKEGEQAKLEILKKTGPETVALPQNVSVNDLKEHIALSDRKDREKASQTVKLFFPHPLLKCGISLIDCPGFDEANIDRWPTTEQQVAKADICILCVDASKGVTAEDMKCLKLVQSKCERVLVVLTKTDTIIADNFCWQSGETTSDRKVLEEKLNHILNEFSIAGFSSKSIFSLSLKEVTINRAKNQPLPAPFQNLCDQITRFIKESWSKTTSAMIAELLTACDIILNKTTVQQPKQVRATNQIAADMWTGINADLNKRKPEFTSKINEALTRNSIQIIQQYVAIAESSEMVGTAEIRLTVAELGTRATTPEETSQEIASDHTQSTERGSQSAIYATDKKLSDSHSELMFKVAVQALLPKGQDAKNYTFREIFYPHLFPDVDLENDNATSGRFGWVNTIVNSGMLLGATGGLSKFGGNKVDGSSVPADKTSAKEFAKRFIEDPATPKEFANMFIQMLQEYTKKQEKIFQDRLQQMETLSQLLPHDPNELPLQIAYLKMKLLSIQFTRAGQIVTDTSSMTFLAAGGQGVVFKSKINGEDVAVKRCKALQEGQPAHLMPFYEAHILWFISCWMDKDYFYMATELMDADLSSQLKNLTREKRLDAGLQIARAMQTMHNFNMAHRDLKTANALIREKPWQVKLADTGESKAAQFYTRQRTPVGTPGFIAPEYYQKNAPGPVDGMKADVYSFGVVMWQLHTAKDIPIALKDGERPPAPESPTEKEKEYINMMNQCLDVNPNRRPDFSALASWLGTYTLSSSK